MLEQLSGYDPTPLDTPDVGEQDDRECPNYDEHARNASQKLTTAAELRRSLQAQLAVNAEDLPSDYDWGYCLLTSAVGNAEILKVRLGMSGHVFLVKGSAPSDLNREATLYTRLQHLQGKHVPVSLGTMELHGDAVVRRDTWAGELVIAGLLLLGWAGHGVDSWPRMGLSRPGEADHAFFRDLTTEAQVPDSQGECSQGGRVAQRCGLANVWVTISDLANTR